MRRRIRDHIDQRRLTGGEKHLGKFVLECRPDRRQAVANPLGQPRVDTALRFVD